jgi:hypothetical protein
MMAFSVISILAFIATLAFKFIPFFVKNEKKEKEKLYLRLSQEGTANDLIFCSQEIFQDKVIGFDGIHRKIMMLEKSENEYNCSVIALDEVQNCELITDCGDHQEANKNSRGQAKDLQEIELRFEFKNHAQPASIIFYNNIKNSKRELLLLQAKAEYWSQMFSKMLTREIRIRA